MMVKSRRRGEDDDLRVSCERHSSRNHSWRVEFRENERSEKEKSLLLRCMDPLTSCLDTWDDILFSIVFFASLTRSRTEDHSYF